MDNAPKVSVLTPVYNVEPYLRQCMESLVFQTLDDIEFICINDGSTDGSLEILEEYAARDSRIRVIDKPNSGYGASMNRGLREARGEYIGIVESDDYADPEMFEALYEAALEYDCDIARSNRYRLTEISDTFDEVLVGLPYNTVFRPLANQRVFDPAPCIWSQIYKREMLLENDVRFLETPGASFQDTGFVYKAYIAASRMVLLPDAYLHYRMDNAGSSVKSMSKVHCVADEFHSISEYLKARSDAYQEFKYGFEALRYQAYQWNYERLGWEARRDFIKTFAEDARQAHNEGALRRECFNDRDWERLNRLIEDEDALFKTEAPYVSVIVPAFNCERHILDTLSSLKNQTMSRIEVIVVDDGSSDSTAELVEGFCARDGRFRLISQENKGVSGARNTGLNHAVGRYVSFIDGEDSVPPIGLDMLYRTAEIRKVDLVVGSIREFGPAIEEHVFDRTRVLAMKESIDRYDFDMLWSFSVNNKLFRRSLIEMLGLRFDETACIAEDGKFLMGYVFDCNGIAGTPHQVLDYRRSVPMSNKSATHRVSKRMVADLIRCHEWIIERASESIQSDLDAAPDEEMRRRLSLLQITYVAEIHRRLASFLVDLHYRMVWLLDESEVELIRSTVAEHIRRVPEGYIGEMAEYHADLEGFPALMTKEELRGCPLVSMIVTKTAKPSDLPALLDVVYHNRFPRFEMLIPESLGESVPSILQDAGNITYVADSCSNAEYKKLAFDSAKASMVLFIDGRVFPGTNALRDLWKKLRDSQADFIAARIRAVNPESDQGYYFKSQKVAFDRLRAEGYSRRDKINALDCHLGNKLIKADAIRRNRFRFADSDEKDSNNLYSFLSYEKSRSTLMVTDLSEREFLGGLASPAMLAVLAAERIQGTLMYPDAAKKKAEEITSSAIKKAAYSASVKREGVLFFSNRGYTDNIRLVYESMRGRKTLMVDPLPHSGKYDSEVVRAMRRSKLIVTDDVCHYLREVELHPDQKVVQLWHACGAFKRFGLDNLQVGPSAERAVHKRYDSVVVSSEYVRPVYAQAFGIPVSKVLPLGVSRTDLLFDKAVESARIQKVLGAYPELSNKRIALYCPTFRQDKGRQCSWNPGIDWDHLSESLPDDMLLAVKAHPLERFDPMGGRHFKNIRRLTDVSADDLLPMASVLVTDYSSIVFDAALLDIPIVLYAPDLPEYSTGFYLRYPEDIPGAVAEDQSMLAEEIARAVASGVYDASVEEFKSRQIGACDGDSTLRIVKYLEGLL